ncbi:MAG TPA: hypothetical protein VJP79_03940 [Nitrososphaera sp.]|nr:hypothetical protein [Nitrososphaera sp.]
MTEIKQKLTRIDESKPAVAGPEIGSEPVDIPAISPINSEFTQHHAVMDLRFIVIPVTNTERRAITKYAEACGETVADLMRKSVIRDATLADCSSSVEESSHYQYHFKIPQSLTQRQERKFIESRYNQIRKILGWAPVRI